MQIAMTAFLLSSLKGKSILSSEIYVNLLLLRQSVKVVSSLMIRSTDSRQVVVRSQQDGSPLDLRPSSSWAGGDT